MAKGELPPFSTELVTDEDGNAVVIVHGEIDLYTAPRLLAALLEACAEHDGRVVVDMADVSFMDSQGVKVLLQAHEACDVDLARLVVRSPQPQTRQVLELTGIATILRLED